MPKKVMVVDDDPVIKKYLVNILNDNGYETCSAGTGVEAYEVLKKEKPDLITLDVTMPLRSGVRTYEMYKRDPELSDIPIIIITAVDETQNDFLSKIQGSPVPQGFMSKPIDTARLLKLTASLLSGREK